MWVPPEDKDPVVLHAPTRKSCALFGAVNVLTGKLVHMLAPKFNAESFTVFLGNLARHRSRKRKMILILDNASYHRSVSLESFLEVRRQCLKLEFLPPYSPDLNPIERVWKLTRKLCTHNQYFPCMEDLVHAVTHQLTIWSKPNSVLAKLCCIT